MKNIIDIRNRWNNESYYIGVNIGHISIEHYKGNHMVSYKAIDTDSYEQSVIISKDITSNILEKDGFYVYINPREIAIQKLTSALPCVYEPIFKTRYSFEVNDSYMITAFEDYYFVYNLQTDVGERVKTVDTVMAILAR